MKRPGKQFSEEEVVKIAQGMFSAIDHFHSRNYIHRDIKPANIMLKSPNDFTTVKLVDFGLATHFRVDPHTSAGLKG